MTSLLLFSVLLPGLGLLVLHLFFLKRARKVEHIQPTGSLLYDTVKWGQIGTFSLLKMGVLALYDKDIVLYDKNNTEIFRYPIGDVKISFTSVRLGMEMKVGDKKYDVRIDYGSVPAFFTVSDRYTMWADKIQELGGRHFLNDQNKIERVIFRPQSNRLLFIACLTIAALFFLMAFMIAFSQ